VPIGFPNTAHARANVHEDVGELSVWQVTDRLSVVLVVGNSGDTQVM
jgi:hypothetical protein